MNGDQKFIINKYKNKTFKEVRNIILTKDLKYYSFLQRLYLKDNLEKEKKANLDSFLKYWEVADSNNEENVEEQIIKDKEDNKDKEKKKAKKEDEEYIEIYQEEKKEIEKFEENILGSEDISINKVYHISDVHIRLYQRFEEYQKVFEKLYKFLREEKKENKNSVVVITGDILHSKITLSPECILLTHSFFSNCAEVFPTFIIAGNHDALLTNNQRIDAITPIIENSKIENLFYLKYSGIYRYGNLCFGISSLLDGKWVYGDQIEKKKETDIKIALYHGGVGEFETGVGFRMRGEKLISDFDGYDYVMLGDIHKFQFLDSEKKRIAYASSLITQNFNEWNTDHGVLRWDIMDDKHEYFPIENNSKFIVLSIEEQDLYYLKNKINDITEIISTETKSLSLKLNIKNASPIFVKKVITDIQKIVKDVKIQYNFVKENEDEKGEHSNEVNINMESLDDWLVYYLENIKKTTDKKLIANVLSEFKKYSEEISIQRDKSLNKWVLLDLYFSNMFGYGEGNYIDFTRFYDNSLIGILAPNSYGKSTIIDIILFILFGKFSRNTGLGLSKDIINVNEKTFECRLKFKIGNDQYVIEKKGKREKSGKIKITMEEFFKMNGEEKEILTDESRIKTDKIISDYIGSMDEFVFTNIQLQNRDRSFKDMTNKERKEFLFKILKLDIFEKVYKLLNGDIRKVKQDYDYYKKTLGKLDIKTLDEDKKELEEKINSYQEKINGYQEQKEDIDQKNTELYNSLKLVDDKYKFNNIEEKRESYEKVKDQHMTKSKFIEEIKEEIIKLNGEIKELKLLEREEEIESEYKKLVGVNKNRIENINNKIIESKCLIKDTININNILGEISEGCKIDLNFFKEKKKDYLDREKEIEKESERLTSQKSVIDEKINNENFNFEKMERYYQNEIKTLQMKKLKNTDEKWKFDSDMKLLLKEDIDIKKDTLSTLENKKENILEELERIKSEVKEENSQKKKLEKRLIRKEKIEKKIKIIERERDQLEEIDKKEIEIEHINNIIENFSNFKYKKTCEKCEENKLCCEKISKNYASELDRYKRELEEMKGDVTYNREEEKEILERYENIKNVDNDILKNQNKIQVLNSKISENKFTLKNLENEQQSIVTKIDLYDKNKQRYAQNKILDKEIVEYEKQIQDNESKLLECSKERNKLSDELHKVEGEISELEEERKKNRELSKLIKECKEKYKENKKIEQANCKLNEKIKLYEKEKEEIENEEYEDYEELKMQKQKDNEIKVRINEKEKELIRQEKGLFSLEKEKIEIVDLISGYDKNFENIEFNKNVNRDIQEKLKERKLIEENISVMSEKVGEFIQENNQLLDLLEEHKNNIIIFKDKENELKQLQILEGALGRDGIPLLMLEKYLPLIETNINNIIYPFIQRKIVLSLESENIIFESYIENADKSVMIHGGMEAFILDLAFKITLSKYAMLPKCDILFIDEGISAFDKERLNSIDVLFQFLKINFNKIILITHIDQVKDEINSKIEIYKKNNRSQIKCCYSV